MTLENVLLATAALVSIASAISAAEYLCAVSRYATSDILSWHVARFQFRPLRHPFLVSLAEKLFSRPGIAAILTVRLVAALTALVFAAAGHVCAPCFLILLITTSLFSFRSPFGLDGAYQMTLVILAAVFVAGLFPAESLACRAAVTFVAAQGMLAYFIAGVAKVGDPVWRNGTALVGIFSTSIYGHPAVYRALKRRTGVALLLCWLTIAFECSFPALVLADATVVYCVLAVGIGFHMFNATFMGLNNFLFSFLAAYPSLFWVAGQARLVFQGV